MQMAISDNGRQLWKRLVLCRQEALQKVKQLASDHSYLIHFSEYVSTPNSQLSVAVQTWERHLFEVSELISSFFSRKMPTEKIQE